ncbi:MAG: hypothetical protein RL033_2757 [Pseudomonadota bacterium]|jgi:hypothetical protein
MARRAILVLLALGAVFSFAMGVRSWRWHDEHGWGPYWAGDQRRIDAVAEACVRAAERVRAEPPGAAPVGPSGTVLQ